jgi:hypothetical protein
LIQGTTHNTSNARCYKTGLDVLHLPERTGATDPVLPFSDGDNELNGGGTKTTSIELSM